MNFRSKTTAMVLCFFLGLLGAHWFYLGRERWGRMYLVAAVISSPLGWLTLIGAAALPLTGVLVSIILLLTQFSLFCAVVYDFFTLLSMHPQRFDIEYNR